MKKTVMALAILLCLPLFTGFNVAHADDAFEWRDGDIIFQSLIGGQNEALKLVTGSDYTHCGVVTKIDGDIFVYEAISLVGLKPLQAWIDRGVDGHYVVMRLKDPDVLTPKALNAMQVSAAALANKMYDIWFDWSDDNIYCSELVWKIYERGLGLELVPLRQFLDYDNIYHQEVQRIAKERFGSEIPWDTMAVAPSDLMASPYLEVVASN